MREAPIAGACQMGLMTESSKAFRQSCSERGKGSNKARCLLRRDADMNDAGNPNSNVKRARYARSRHRSQSHEDAHADTPPPARIDLSKHPNVPPGDAEMITMNAQLEELIDDLRKAGSFAYDSEFIGELTYIPKLCLIQVATSKRIAL